MCHSVLFYEKNGVNALKSAFYISPNSIGVQPANDGLESISEKLKKTSNQSAKVNHIRYYSVLNLKKDYPC